MTGVSFMIPFMTIDGIFPALGYVVASFSNNVQNVLNNTGTADWSLVQIGVVGLTLMVPVLGVYIAYAITDRPGFVPGFIPSYIVQQDSVLQAAGDVIGLQGGSVGTGYLGAIVTGFLVGIVACWLKQCGAPESVALMISVLLIPVATAAVLTPVMLFVLGVPTSTASAGFTEFPNNMQGGGQATLPGGIFGAMMTADMGGPVNKVAYTSSIGLISEGVTASVAAVMTAGMVPPIGPALSNFTAPQKYVAEMYENAKNDVPLGFSLVTKGAVPYAAADPACVIPNVVAGSAVAGAASMALGVNMPAPHGGIFVALLSNRPFMLIVYILLGSIATAVIATAIKPNFDVKMAAQSSDD